MPEKEKEFDLTNPAKLVKDNTQKPSIDPKKLETMNTATDIEKEVFKKPITRENAKAIAGKQPTPAKTIWNDPKHPLYSISPSEQNPEFLKSAISEMQRNLQSPAHYKFYAKGSGATMGETRKKLARYQKALKYLESQKQPAKPLQQQQLHDFAMDKIFTKENAEKSKGTPVEKSPRYKKGDRVEMVSPYGTQKEKTNNYEIVGFYNSGNVVDENTADEYNKTYGVRIRNIDTGKEYPVPAHYLKAIQEQPKPSLLERRRKYKADYPAITNRQQQERAELYNRYQNKEISRKEFNKLLSEMQTRHGKEIEYPERDRLPIEDEIDANEKEFHRIRDELSPLQDEDNRAFNRHLMFNEPYDETKKNPRIAELNKQLRGVMDKRDALNRQKALEIGKPFGRKDYREGIDKREYGKGNDRIYALYQYALENPSLDFGRIISNDIWENRDQYPTKIQFDDDLYEISETGHAFDHWTKENGEWKHVSTGTIAGLGDELADKLEASNIVEPKEPENDGYDEEDEFEISDELAEEVLNSRFAEFMRTRGYDDADIVQKYQDTRNELIAEGSNYYYEPSYIYDKIMEEEQSKPQPRIQMPKEKPAQDNIITRGNAHEFLKRNGLDKDYYWDGGDLVDADTNETLSVRLGNAGTSEKFLLDQIKNLRKAPSVDQLNRKTLRSAEIGRAVENAKKNGQSPQQVMDTVSYDLDIEPNSDEYQTLKMYATQNATLDKGTGAYAYDKYTIGSDKLLAQGTPERAKMEQLFRDVRKAGFNDINLVDGWEDRGAEMRWTNLADRDSWILSPRDWLDYMNGKITSEDIIADLKSSRGEPRQPEQPSDRNVAQSHVNKHIWNFKDDVKTWLKDSPYELSDEDIEYISKRAKVRK